MLLTDTATLYCHLRRINLPRDIHYGFSNTMVWHSENCLHVVHIYSTVVSDGNCEPALDRLDDAASASTVSTCCKLAHGVRSLSLSDTIV